MNCSVAQELLQHYLDHQLEPAEARAVEDHVAQCADCRAEFVHLERTLIALENAPHITAPTALYENTMAMIAAKQLAQPSQLFGRFSYSLTNSVLASVALIGIFFAQSAQIDLPGAMDWLEGEGVTGVVNGAMLLAVSAELSFIAGVGLLLSACSIGLLEIVVHRKSST